MHSSYYRTQARFVLLLLLLGLPGALQAGRSDELKAKGAAAEKSGATNQAVEAFSGALRLKPQDIETRRRLAELLFQQGRFEQAAPQFMLLLQYRPEDVLLRKRVAYMRLRLNAPDFEQQIGLELHRSPAPLWAQEYYADWLANNNRAREALGCYQRLLDHADVREEDRRRIRVGHGRALYALGKRQEALDIFTAVLKEDPKNYEAHILRANFYLATDDEPTACKIYEELRRLYPRAEEPVIGLAAIAAIGGQSDQAIRLYDEARRLSPERIDIYFWLTELYHGKRDAKALHRLRGSLSAERREHEPVRAYIDGVLRMLGNDYRAALVQFERTEAFITDYAGLYDKMGICYLQLGQPELAENYFTRSRRDVAKQQELWLALAQSYIAKTNYVRSLRFLEPLSDPRHYAMQAQVHYALGNYGEALKNAQNWVGRQTNAVIGYLIVSECARRLGQSAQFLQALRQIARIEPNSSLGVYARAQVAMAAKDLNEAKAIILDNYQLLRDQAGANLILAEILLQQEKAKEAEQYVRAALSTNPHNARAETLLGLIALEQKRVPEARAAFERAVQADPREPAARQNLGVMEFDANHEAAAAALWEPLVQDNSLPLELLILYARCRLDLQQTELALVGAQTAWELSHHTNALAGHCLVRAWVMNHQLDRAQAILKQLQALAPDQALTDYASALVSQERDTPTVACEKLDAAVRRHPQDKALRMLQVQTLAKQTNFAQADKLAAQLQRDFPRSSELFLLEGNLKAIQRQYPAARDRYQQGLKFDPHSAKLQQAYLMTYDCEDRPRDAAEALEKLLSDDPANDALCFAGAERWEKLRDYARAEKLYQRIRGRNPGDAAVLNNLALVVGRDEKRLDEAVSLAKQADSSTPNRPGILDTLGILLLRRGDTTRAIVLLSTAAQLSPEDPEILFHLARAQIETKDVVAGRASLKRLLARYPDFEQRRDAENMLARLATN